MQYKSCDESDIETIYHLAKQLVLRYEDPTIVDIKHALDWTKRKITSNIHSYQRIYKEDEIVGYYYLEEQVDLTTELSNLYILEPYRHQGIGTEVMKKIIETVDEPLSLCVFVKNTKAISLYDKMGFQVAKMVSKTRMMMSYRKDK